MKKLLITLALLLSPLLAIAGVSINIGEPNYYGRIQLGNERPQLLYAQPVIIQRGRAQYPPVYIRVPSNQSRNWRKYCGGYGLCGSPVYFVNDNWYRNTYAPRYRQHHQRFDNGRGYRAPDRHHDNRRHHGNDRNKHYDRGHHKSRDGRDNRNYDQRH